jgi:hypothetical protein
MCVCCYCYYQDGGTQPEFFPVGYWRGTCAFCIMDGDADMLQEAVSGYSGGNYSEVAARADCPIEIGQWAAARKSPIYPFKDMNEICIKWSRNSGNPRGDIQAFRKYYLIGYASATKGMALEVGGV